MDTRKILNLFQTAKNQADNNKIEEISTFPLAHFIIAVTIHDLGYENILEVNEVLEENIIIIIMNKLKNFFDASGDLYLYLLKLGLNEDETKELMRRIIIC